ncbi:GIY-YIG nuclease family protein [Marinirhabdus gelatinilytica]|nr:GIY-YIG nuclease family protein [Marinirhabdus gelatinilytica]
MSFFTYILFSKTLDRYYVGHTGDVLDERIRKHNSNHKGYTGRASDWKLQYFEVYSTKEEAYARERYIKSRKSKKYLEKLIRNSHDGYTDR